MDDNILLLQEDNAKLNVQRSEAKPFVSNNIFNYSLFVATCILSIVLLIMFFSAADLIKTGGLEIMSIESVGGKTLEEAYYHDLGYIYEGYCVAVRAIGAFCSSVLLLFGVSRLRNAK